MTGSASLVGDAAASSSMSLVAGVSTVIVSILAMSI
jgi:hypothetical protein